MVNKRLFFYFYAVDGYKDMYYYKMHLACLEHYANVFDEAIFVISVNDVNNESLINSVRNDILAHFKCKDIRFKVHKDDDYHESRVFYDMIYKKLDQLDGLTFFAHTKGVSNCYVSNDTMVDWILSLYWLSLSDIKDVCNALIYSHFLFYGSFKLAHPTNEIIFNPQQMFYNGTFYWLNTSKVYNSLLVKKQNILLESRFTCEKFPGYFDNGIYGMASKGDLYWATDFTYDYISEALNFLTSVSRSEYEDFKNTILSNIE
jgi:hypothetical protein